MAELDKSLAAYADDPDLAEFASLVDELLTPKLEEFEREHVDPIVKIIEEVSLKTESINESIHEIDSIYKSTRVMAEDLQANLLKEKIEIDQLIIDSKDAQMRTAENESQLFQSKISGSNPFNLFYLYRSLDKKSHTSTSTTNTSTTSSAAITAASALAPSLISKKASTNTSKNSAGTLQAGVKGNDNSQTKGSSGQGKTDEPEIIDLCGVSEDVANEDVVACDTDALYQPVNTQPAELARGMKLLAKKKGAGGRDEWFEATLLTIITDQGNKKYKVKFDNMGKRLLSGKHIALKIHPPFEVFRIGSRVVAPYRKLLPDSDTVTTVLYSGITAEVPMITNKGRFLIFYDIGYAQYADLEDMYLVYHSTGNVWDDDMGESRDFIMKYLKRYPERPMVRLAVGQWAKTEWNGVWWRAKVKEVDGSLALMHFESDNREEWIYRGSPRLEPLFSELQKAEEAKRMGNKLVASGTSNPYKRRRPTRVEYTTVMKEQLTQPRSKNIARKSTSALPKSPDIRKKKGQTALKSTSMGSQGKEHHKEHHKKHHHHHHHHHHHSSHRKSPSPTPDIFELDDSEESSRPESIPASTGSEETVSATSQSTIMGLPMLLAQPPKLNLTVAELLSSIHQPLPALQPMVQHQQVKRKKRKNQKNFVPHTCNYYCVINCWPSEHSKTFNKNPLRMPEICGWSRELAKMKGSGKRHVVYRTPCGLFLRGLDEVNKYLMETHINYLSVDHFTFDPFIYTLTRKPRTKPIWKIDDISKGTEPMAVSCVNEIDSSPLPSVEYVAHRLPSGGTEINTDPAFLVCCDCNDNCMDKSKCACWQMTIDSTAVSPSGVKDPNAGYINRRLSEHLPTGVFECNSQCKCSQQCHNRAVQNGIKLRLQVFKTNKRGWGLRCLDDIPKGAFVCIYAGQIWKENMANERGRLYGDEYFAELDYIEVVENNKEGYESDVASDDMSARGHNSSDESNNDEGSDADYHAGSDSDADYVPTGMSALAPLGAGGSSQSDTGSVGEAGENTRPRDLAQVSTRLTFRRQLSAEQQGKRNNEQQWSVVPSNKESQDKVENWVKDLPATSAAMQEANNTTPTKAPNTPTSEADTPTRMYGYNTNPGNVLDSKTLEAFRKRKEKEKALRRRKLDVDSPSKGASDVSGDNAITLSSSDEEDSRGSIPIRRNSSPASKPATPASETTANPGTQSGNVYSNSATQSGNSSSNPATQSGNSVHNPATQSSNSVHNPATQNSNSVHNPATQSSNSVHNPATQSSNSTGADTPSNGEAMVLESSQGFGGFQIEGITSLAVESDDTDESDTDETKGGKYAEGVNKKTTSVPKSTQHSRMSLMIPQGAGPQSSANMNQQGDSNRRATPPMRTRPFFGEEHHYIMDAKFIGNLGRYLNHSCSPNLFVQNVFVDTHDLRFPWVAFFAHERIRASTELTWDYNYDVGSVPGKTLPCYCGSNLCKGRLL